MQNIVDVPNEAQWPAKVDLGFSEALHPFCYSISFQCKFSSLKLPRKGANSRNYGTQLILALKGVKAVNFL